MNSPQGNTSSARKGRSICLSAKTEHYTCKYYNLPGQQAYMGRVPIHPGNTHKHTHSKPNQKETVITLVYADAGSVR